MTPEKQVSGDDLTNLEITTLAVFLLGGSAKVVDTEFVAMKADSLAPGRFRWRHFKDQVNLGWIRTFLKDARKQGYVTGNGPDGWMLTELGLEFAETNRSRVETEDLGLVTRTKRDSARLRRERDRMLGTNAWRKFRESRLDEITDQDVATFFRIDEYVTVDVRNRKLLRVLNEFRDDSDLGEAVRLLAERMREGMQNDATDD